MSLLATPPSWPQILNCIQKRITPQQYATWFRHLKASLPADDEIHIRVPNRFFKEWLAQNYLGVIKESIREAIGSQPSVAFTVDENILLQDASQEVAPPEVVVESTPLPRISGMTLNEDYTFDTFVVGPSNQLAHAAAIAVTDAPGKTYNPLFMFGSVGLGKSHLLQAICYDLLSKNPRAKAAYFSCETFVNEFILAIQRNNLPAFRNRYRQLDLLLIDDIQFLSRAERSQEEFFHTFNDLYNAQKQIVLSSDQPPQNIDGLQERLLSRFKCGLVARIDPPSYEMRVAILKRKAELRHVSLPAEVIDYIANTITTNIRELDGAVTKVVGYASLLNQPISLSTAQTALHEPAVAKSPLSIESIIGVVTNHFAVRVSDIQSKKRTRSIVFPRQVCMYLARILTTLSLEEIGGYFGGRDHSTVLHAEEKIRSAIKEDRALATTIELLKTQLQSDPTSRVSNLGG